MGRRERGIESVEPVKAAPELTERALYLGFRTDFTTGGCCGHVQRKRIGFRLSRQTQKSKRFLAPSPQVSGGRSDVCGSRNSQQADR